jgi:hypothetical protein
VVATAAQSQWCKSPPPLHTPTRGITTGQRADESDQHSGADPNFLTYSPRTADVSRRQPDTPCVHSQSPPVTPCRVSLKVAGKPGKVMVIMTVSVPF